MTISSCTALLRVRDLKKPLTDDMSDVPLDDDDVCARERVAAGEDVVAALARTAATGVALAAVAVDGSPDELWCGTVGVEGIAAVDTAARDSVGVLGTAATGILPADRLSVSPYRE